MPPTTSGGNSQLSIATRMAGKVAVWRSRKPATVRLDMATLLGDIDLHLIGEGRHRRLWDALGAHVRPDGGVRFSVWAPNARAVRVVGEWNDWDGRVDALVPQG